MKLNEYQNEAFKTCTPSSYNLEYLLLNLVGEVGEFAGKVAKHIRQNGLEAGYSELANSELLKYEAGDILWQLATLCKYFGWNLADIAEMNLAKLSDRQERNKIVGSGDKR